MDKPDIFNIFIQYFLPVIISALLIIGNEWLKEWLNRNYQRKKYKLWKEIYDSTLKKAPDRVVRVEEPNEFIYELLRDGMLEFDELSNLGVKHTKLPERLNPRF